MFGPRDNARKTTKLKLKSSNWKLERLPKVAVEKVGVSSTKFLLPVAIVAYMPSPTINTFHLDFSTLTLSSYTPFFT